MTLIQNEGHSVICCDVVHIFSFDFVFSFQSLTNGSGFYEATSKELWTEGRKIVIKNKDTEEYFDDFSGVSKGGQKEAFM